MTPAVPSPSPPPPRPLAAGPPSVRPSETVGSARPSIGAVLDRLLVLAGRLHGRMAEIAAAHDLTPQQAKLIRVLDEPRPMGVVAEILACDPSNVTGLIARIERRGLVARRPDPADRRVRLLVLTPAGWKVRDVLEGELVREAAALSRLAPDEVAQLVALLDRVAIGGAGGVCSIDRC